MSDTSNPDAFKYQYSNSSHGLFSVSGHFTSYFDKYGPQVPKVPSDIVSRTLETVQQHLGPEGKILNLYLWGSRWYLNHVDNSDYDLLAVVTDYVQPATSNVISVGDHIDVALCEVNYFQKLLDDHVPWAVNFFFYPPFGIIFEHHKFRYELLLRQQKRALTINSQVNLNQAASLWRHGDVYRAKKRVFFVIQMTIFSTQIAETGAIYDFWEAPNQYRAQLFDPKLDTWDAFKIVWRPIFDQLVDQYIKIRNAYQGREVEMLKTRNCAATDDYLKDGKGPLVIEYIRQHGFQSLKRDFHIESITVETFSNLVCLTYTPKLSPVDSIIVTECNGLVLDRSDDWRVICMPHHRIYDRFVEGPFTIDWNSPNLKVYQRLDGTEVHLFFNQNQWQLVSLESKQTHNVFISPKVSSAFWEAWNKLYGTELLSKMDKHVSYTFLLIHPETRKLIYYGEELSIVLCVARRMFPVSEAGKQVPMEEISHLGFKLLEPQSTSDLDLNNMSKIPYGGLIVQQGPSDPRIRVSLNCPLLNKFARVVELEGDILPQEIEILNLLAENPDCPTAWNWPLPEYQDIFERVRDAFVELISVVDKHLPTLGSLDKKSLSLLVKDLEDVSHFLFLIKSSHIKCKNASEYFQKADQKRMKKYLENWWMRNHSTVPRTNLQYSYK